MNRIVETHQDAKGSAPNELVDRSTLVYEAPTVTVVKLKSVTLGGPSGINDSGAPDTEDFA